MRPEEAKALWAAELEQPGEGFFAAAAARLRQPDGARDATLEAMEFLIPRVDWKGYLPHVPHGLLGTWAVWALRPRLAESSFHRALAAQMHAFAHEARDARQVLAMAGAGSGNWANIRSALHARRPSIAWGECQGVDAPAASDFLQVAELAAHDMANVGHKPVLAWAMESLFGMLAAPRTTGRKMLGLCAWLAASEPVDLFWHQRASVRLGEAPPGVSAGSAREAEGHAAAAREVCDLGLVDLLDRWCARLKGGPARGDLLSILALAAAEKQLDARRDLEGKTAWNWVYLAALAEGGERAAFAQAAALVNLFPTDEEEGRVQARAPRTAASDPVSALQEAILDAEVPEAMFLARLALGASGPEAVLAALAEAASRNDPAFNHSHQVLAVAAAAKLIPGLTGAAGAATLEALAKFLANSQGSADLGRLADRALAHPGA